MRARSTLLLTILTLIGVAVGGCSQPTMQGTAQRQPGMILSSEDLPGAILSEQELADLADIGVDQVTNWADVDPKADPPASVTEPEICQALQLSREYQGVTPKTYGISAFHSDGAEEADLGYELGAGVVLFESPAMAAARFEDLKSQVGPCSEYELFLEDGTPLLLQVTTMDIDGLTLPAVSIVRKAVVAPALQAAGFGISIAETFLLFRNTIARASFREAGVRQPDPARMTELSVALQQHLLTLT